MISYFVTPTSVQTSSLQQKLITFFHCLHKVSFQL